MDVKLIILGVICLAVICAFIYEKVRAKVDPALKAVRDKAIADAKDAMKVAKGMEVKKPSGIESRVKALEDKIKGDMGKAEEKAKEEIKKV